MKVKDILALAAAIRGEAEPMQSQQQISIRYLNILLEDCKDLENSIRQNQDYAALQDAPTVSSIEDDVDYSASVLKAVIPYGIAECLYRLEGDMDNATVCQSKYLSGKAAFMRCWVD